MRLTAPTAAVAMAATAEPMFDAISAATRRYDTDTHTHTHTPMLQAILCYRQGKITAEPPTVRLAAILR